MVDRNDLVARAVRLAFKNEHLSVSRLKKYEECAHAFFLGYVSKGIKVPPGVAPQFGIALHAALEALYVWVVAEEYEGPFPVAKLLEFYQAAWIEAYELDEKGQPKQRHALVGPALYQEGVELLRRYAKSHPTVNHMAILGVELEFNIDIGGFVVNGYIDRIDKIADDHIAIIDYKSNRALFSSYELENDLQMSIYGIVARQLYPWAKKVSFVFHMLRHDTHQGTDRTAEQLDDAAAYVVAIGKRTESDPVYAPTLNSNCGYCDHRIRCKEYQEAIAGKHPIVKATDLSKLDEVARERETVAKLAKMLYARKSELDELIKAKIAHDGETRLGDTVYRLQNSFETSYPSVDVVQRTFAKLAGVDPKTVAERVVGVNKNAVKELLEEQKEKLPRGRYILLETTLEGVATRKPQTPKLDTVKAPGARKPDAEKGSTERASRGTTPAEP